MEFFHIVILDISTCNCFSHFGCNVLFEVHSILRFSGFASFARCIPLFPKLKITRPRKISKWSQYWKEKCNDLTWHDNQEIVSRKKKIKNKNHNSNNNKTI
jgi:hypothetical protein